MSSRDRIQSHMPGTLTSITLKIYNFFLKNSVCELQNAFIPVTPHSLPIPLSLWPPNGVIGETSICAFTQTFPASSCFAIRAASSKSEDHTEAPRPILVLFARAMTSSSSDHCKIGTIGPGLWARSHPSQMARLTKRLLNYNSWILGWVVNDGGVDEVTIAIRNLPTNCDFVRIFLHICEEPLNTFILHGILDGPKEILGIETGSDL